MISKEEKQQRQTEQYKQIKRFNAQFTGFPDTQPDSQNLISEEQQQLLDRYQSQYRPILPENSMPNISDIHPPHQPVSFNNEVFPNNTQNRQQNQIPSPGISTLSNDISELNTIFSASQMNTNTTTCADSTITHIPYSSATESSNHSQKFEMSSSNSFLRLQRTMKETTSTNETEFHKIRQTND